MSRPRRPFGTDLPGRLQGTLLKVVAAEMSDSSRLTRGKRLHADGAVIDLIVGSGTVNAEVQGSRSQPYVVTIETDPGSGAPSRRDLWVQCSCPDDVGTGTTACKHVVATMFALADEVSIEPEVLDRWRAGRPRLRVLHDDDGDGDIDDDDDDDREDDDREDFATGTRRLRAVPSGPAAEPAAEPAADPITEVFGSPDHSHSATLGDIEPMVYRHHPNRQLDELLVSALEELTGRSV